MTDNLDFTAYQALGHITVFGGTAVLLGNSLQGVWTDIDTAQRICDLVNEHKLLDLADLASIEGEHER